MRTPLNENHEPLFFDNVEVDSDIEQLARLGYSLAVENVEFRDLEGRRDLILNDLALWHGCRTARYRS